MNAACGARPQSCASAVINADSEMVNDDTAAPEPAEQLALGCPERGKGDAGTARPLVPGPFATNCQLYWGTDLP